MNYTIASMRKNKEYKFASFLKSGLISGGFDMTTIILLKIIANIGKLPPAIIASINPKNEYIYFLIN